MHAAPRRHPGINHTLSSRGAAHLQTIRPEDASKGNVIVLRAPLSKTPNGTLLVRPKEIPDPPPTADRRRVACPIIERSGIEPLCVAVYLGLVPALWLAPLIWLWCRL
jgi:hypothetical protein